MVSSGAAALFLLEPNCLACGMIIEAGEIVLLFYGSVGKQTIVILLSERVIVRVIMSSI